MRELRQTISILLIASVLWIGACAGISLSSLPFLNRANPTPAVLARCDPKPKALCLITFGVDELGQMLIVLHVPPKSPQPIRASVTYKDKTTDYPCQVAKEVKSAVYCTGPRVPLSSTITIEIYVAGVGTQVASGDFVINALALPSVPVLEAAAASRTGRPIATPRPSITLTIGTPGPSRTPGAPTPTHTRTPGTGYPSP